MSEQTKSSASTVLDVPYIVVDATLGALLEDITEPPLTWHWRALTSGSSRRFLRGGRANVMVIGLYAVALERTQIWLDIPGFEKRDISGSAEATHAVLRSLHDAIIGIIPEEQLRDAMRQAVEVLPKLAPRQLPTAGPVVEPKPASPPTADPLHGSKAK